MPIVMVVYAFYHLKKLLSAIEVRINSTECTLKEKKVTIQVIKTLTLKTY